MRTFINIIWHFPFMGFLFSFVYLLIGVFFCMTIILIPVGVGYFQISKFLLAPFSRYMVTKNELAQLNKEKISYTSFWQIWCLIARILYFIPSLFSALGTICIIVLEFCTLIGIPCGIVYAKLLSSIFNPVNKVCVPKVVADEIANTKNARILSKYGTY